MSFPAENSEMICERLRCETFERSASLCFSGKGGCEMLLIFTIVTQAHYFRLSHQRRIHYGWLKNHILWL